MSTAQLETQDTGLALLPEQETWVAALNAGARREAIAHCLRVDIHGEPDVPRLQQALDSLLARHAALAMRLGSVAGYHGQRQFMPEASVQVFDLQVQPDAAPEAWLAEPWPAAGPFVQALLSRVTQGRWVLVLALARFVGDAGSLKVMFDALVQAYLHAAAVDDEEPGQFAQYLEWRSEVLFDEDADTAKAYWQAHLPASEACVAPCLPYRRATAQPAAALKLEATLEEPLQAQLAGLAQRLGVTLDTVLQAAWWTLLARISGRHRFVGGWRHDGRKDYAFFENSIGVFEKTLPLVVHVDQEQPFEAWVTDLAAQLEQHATWQEYAAGNLPVAYENPLYGFAARAALLEQVVGTAQWQATRLAEAQPRFELLLSVSDTALRLDAEAGRYSQVGLEVLLGQYQALLHSIAAHSRQALGRLNLSGAADNAALLALNPAVRALEDRVLLPERIAQWAAITPDAPALVSAGVTLSYAELEQRVARLAFDLVTLGVGQGGRVGLALPRSTQWVVAMLACWRVGAAYLPLDPQWPVARQLQMLEQAQPGLVLTEQAQLAQLAGQGVVVQDIALLGHVDGDVASPALSATDVAYVLFTSGSSGTPKGVVVEHQQLLNYAAGVCQQLQLDACRHFALSSTVAADLGNTALLGALYLGAALHVADDDSIQSPEAFAHFMREQAIDCLKIVPSHLAALLEAQAPHLPATLVLGGEAIGVPLLQRIAEIRPDCRVFNHYGPTETTVGVLVHRVTAADMDAGSVPLTEVLPNNQVLVLDEHLQAVAIGELGELYIGGRQLARGYLNAPEQTAQVFIEHPLQPGERLYRSGDLARYRPEGGVQLYGRRDQQVKVRGFRIELAEIEVQLASLAQVSEAVAVLVDAEPVAFLVLREGAGQEAAAAVTAQLALRLPAPMLPRHVQVLAQMPRLANGKVDRQALQQRPLATAEVACVAPRDAVEELLASRMAQLLGLERLSVEQDFFAAGGHSLLVIKLVAGIRKLLQCDVHPGVVFDNPSVAALAQALRSQEAAPGQLEKLAAARLRLDSMTPEQRAQLLAKAQNASA
ncbi:non-ribosomal peptide synthetase [Pseudomonas sp. 1176_21]|uniref:non-ribosomal peptide synthetase n=1 Tax=Pseudomonas sp. 1176_21 TaxID=2604453 RepID=UPI000E23E361